MTVRIAHRNAMPGRPQLAQGRYCGHLDLHRAQKLEGLEMVPGPGGWMTLTGLAIDQAVETLHHPLAWVRPRSGH